MSGLIFRTALIGNPTEHSVSDVMFKEIYRVLNLEQEYKHLKITVPESDLKQVVDKMINSDFLGFNVTLPYKRKIKQYLTSTDSSSEEVDAVNTVKISKSETIGYNTDWEGIYHPVKKYCTSRGYSICIFGTGGASRAAIHAGRKLTSGDIFVIYRGEKCKSENTKNLLTRADDYGIILKEYADVLPAVSQSKVIINTTPVGMRGYADCYPFSLASLSNIDFSGKIFMDAVFNPVETISLKYFNERGTSVIDGLWMMIFQGVSALSIWLDMPITLSDVEFKRIHNKLEAAVNGNNFDD